MFLKTRKVAKYSLLFSPVFLLSAYNVYADNKEDIESLSQRATGRTFLFNSTLK
jgi:hypothetical protein